MLQHGLSKQTFCRRDRSLLSARNIHRHTASCVANFLFKLGLASRGGRMFAGPSQPGSAHRLDAGGRESNPSSRIGANGDSSFQVFWEDGERVFCRGWGHGARGSWKAGLAVLPVAEPLGGSMIDAPADGSEPRTRLSVSIEG
jgi:hypothetical protein